MHIRLSMMIGFIKMQIILFLYRNKESQHKVYEESPARLSRSFFYLLGIKECSTFYDFRNQQELVFIVIQYFK
jgi:hypothetical protein